MSFSSPASSRLILRFRVAAASAIAMSMLAAARLPASASVEPGADECRTEYIIGAEDVLDVAVWDNAAITRTVPVRPDGKISLPLLNDVHAAGLTPMQLRDALLKELSEYMPSPSVSVLVREIHSFKVAVIGQVKSPGRYEIRGRATVLDLLAMAGGLTDYADKARIAVMRQDRPAARRIPFPYDRVVAKAAANQTAGAAQTNFCVQPGDVIVVP